MFIILLLGLCIVQTNNEKLFLKNLGANIRAIRLSKKMTQLDLAVAMDNYAEQIGRIERGISDVRITTILRIANALEVSLEELLVSDN